MIRSIAGATLLALFASVANAQTVDSGAVLRVTTREGAVVTGPLVNWSAVGVTLVGREGDPTSPSSFRLADLHSVEVRSVSRRTWQGALIGLALGVGSAGSYCGKHPATKDCPQGMVGSALIGGATGALYGALIGAMIHRESWEPVQLAPR